MNLTLKIVIAQPLTNSGRHSGICDAMPERELDEEGQFGALGAAEYGRQRFLLEKAFSPLFYLSRCRRS